MDWYEKVARKYEATYGEPLVATAEYVEPLFSACELAVAASADTSYDDFVGGAGDDEVVARTAAVIAMITHGEKGAIGALPKNCASCGAVDPWICNECGDPFDRPDAAEGGYTGVFVDGVKVAESRKVDLS